MDTFNVVKGRWRLMYGDRDVEICKIFKISTGNFESIYTRLRLFRITFFYGWNFLIRSII